jgi:hypothetical protein
MYSISASTAEVVMLSSGKVVAPCQSDHDPDFLAYVAWVEVGENQPTEVA